ncbi:TfoX/Sxy family protein [Antrihabitans cavernicola]|uniref:TfoX/Sxy family protein n=1 Tax=Antrihabitans cavernicola TaxID=2495913 RepID=A0A5A7S3N0_9NOCA|nr:TfoX/Sxy family protein [Spelaeibacter cavernicola]KAA0019495.1 TfoX/Sxy family protein [Spelaeibacter cavernicola]
MTRASLIDRIRTALSVEPTTRDVAMFGGLSFMVNDRMVVAARADGSLLVRIDPRRSSELLAIPGAGHAEMGARRSMGTGWISVAPESITTKDRLSFWLDVALEFNGRSRSD